jgi:acetyl esterase/lipase
MSDDILSLPPPAADFRLAYGSDPNQFVDLRLPARGSGQKKPFPLAINIHGGFWRARYNLDQASHLCAALTAQGLATANVEYRRVGNDGGGWPGSFADIRAAFHFVLQNAEEHGFDRTKFLVMGHSAGGQLALWLAAHETQVTRVVSLAGVVDLRRAYELHLSNDAVVEFLGGTPRQVPDHYREADPMELSSPQARQMLIHGTADENVPIEFSRAYVSAKRQKAGSAEEEVELREMPGAGHLDLIDPWGKAWKVVERSVSRLLA